MKGLRDLLLKEQKYLEGVIKELKSRIEDSPEGRLRISRSHDYVQYYWCRNEKKTGIYISKDNIILVRQLAQKAYDEKVLKMAEKRLLQIKKIVRDYRDDEIEMIYLKEREERQVLINPVVYSWEEKIRRWKEEEYEGKEFDENAPLILTEKGERVRSKSEKIMADYFFREGIEYKYEHPLYLKGVGMVYPDFTFLSKKNDKEVYWEHNGKVDDPAYARKMVKKINLYENNGIYVGERLILTYETEYTVLNTGKIEALVKKYLR